MNAMRSSAQQRVKLVITVDTESDDLWARQQVPTFDNIAELPALQRLCDGHEAQANLLG